MNTHTNDIRLGEYVIAYRHTTRAPTDGAPTIVLVHGAGCSSLDWPHAWFDSRDSDLGGHAVYALDLPGHGGSSGELIADIPAMGALVTEFIERLGLRDVCLVGHSMGSAIVIASALEKHPQISRLVLIAGAARFGVQQGLLDGLSSHFEATASKVAEASWHGAADTSLKDKTIKTMLEAGQRILLNDFSACRAANLMGELSDLSVPVLAIASRHDRLVNLKVIQEMCALIDRCQLETYEDTGHFVQLEKSQEIAEQIKRFVDNTKDN